MKRLFKISILFLLCFSAIFIFGCNCSGDEKNEEPLPSRLSFTLNTTSTEMIIGDEFYLIASYEPVEGLSVKYESSAPQIACVDENGKITALKPGSAEMTVSYGTATAKCAVSVGFGNLMPRLRLEQGGNGFIRLACGDVFELCPYLEFNGKRFDDVVFSYYYDESIADLENGVVTAKAKGSTSVTIKAEWMGLKDLFSLTEEFVLEVTDVVSFVINNGENAEFEIYSISDTSKGCNNEMPFSVTAKLNGQTEISDITVSVTEGSDVIGYSDDKIVSLGKTGEGTIKVSCVYGGETFERYVKAKVLPVVYEYDEIVDYSAMDGELPLKQIFGKNVTLKSAEIEGKPLSVHGNRITDVIAVDGKAAPAVREITVYNEQIGYKVNARIYTKIIRKASDLSIFKLQKDTDTFSGYYILANDIDASGYLHETVYSGLKNVTEKKGGLTGTFDGNGHTIINLTFAGENANDDTHGLYGLFGEIYGGIIKNVAFKNVTLNHLKSWTSLFAGIIGNATISNIYVSITLSSVGVSSAVLAHTLNSAKLTNCVFEVESTQGAYRGSLFGAPNNVDTSEWSDVYVISEGELAKKDYQGVITVSDATNKGGTLNVLRYETVEEMANADNDYSSFTETYWKIEGGIPVWAAEINVNVADDDTVDFNYGYLS